MPPWVYMPPLYASLCVYASLPYETGLKTCTLLIFLLLWQRVSNLCFLSCLRFWRELGAESLLPVGRRLEAASSRGCFLRYAGKTESAESEEK